MRTASSRVARGDERHARQHDSDADERDDEISGQLAEFSTPSARHAVDEFGSDDPQQRAGPGASAVNLATLVEPVREPQRVSQAPDTPSADEVKRQKRERKQRVDAVRSLDSWERYRALVDASEEAFDLIDIANREARFALIVMGALNAVPLVLISRAETLALLSRGEVYLIGGLFLGYCVLVLTIMLRAIEALKPGRFRLELADWPSDALDRPAGIRHYEDIIQRSVREHWSAWQRVRIPQLNAELAIQVHNLARQNHAKQVSLGRIYAGLRVMALMLAGLSLLFVVLAWT
jgi:hypothetical protein